MARVPRNTRMSDVMGTSIDPACGVKQVSGHAFRSPSFCRVDHGTSRLSGWLNRLARRVRTI